MAKPEVLRAAPRGILDRIGKCRVALVEEAPFASQWTETGEGIEVTLAAGDPHDTALELLLCIGQALWERLTPAETRAWLRELDAEIRHGVPGEIDEFALEEKRVLLGSRAAARSSRALQRYARAAFAGTVAEYIHALWHDVTVRTGPDHLPAAQLRRRFETLARWFPPPRGRRLFPE
ncbi:MAG: hypothetical protein ACE15B_05880 [Bryobacteraceae bacterium]